MGYPTPICARLPPFAAPRSLFPCPLEMVTMRRRQVGARLFRTASVVCAEISCCWAASLLLHNTIPTKRGSSHRLLVSSRPMKACFVDRPFIEKPKRSDSARPFLATIRARHCQVFFFIPATSAPMCGRSQSHRQTTHWVYTGMCFHRFAVARSPLCRSYLYISWSRSSSFCHKEWTANAITQMSSPTINDPTSPPKQ